MWARFEKISFVFQILFYWFNLRKIPFWGGVGVKTNWTLFWILDWLHFGGNEFEFILWWGGDILLGGGDPLPIISLQRNPLLHLPLCPHPTFKKSNFTKLTYFYDWNKIRLSFILANIFQNVLISVNFASNLLSEDKKRSGRQHSPIG